MELKGAKLLCDWGRRVGLPWDREHCPEVGVRDVELHDPHRVMGGGSRLLRLCDPHFIVVVRETDPHREREPV